MTWLLLGTLAAGLIAAGRLVWLLKMSGDKARAEQRAEIAEERAKHAEREAKIHADPDRDKRTVVSILRDKSEP